MNDNCLYYFEYTTDKEPRGIIPLENIQVREVQDRHKPHCFELYAAGSEFIKACKTDSEGKVVEGTSGGWKLIRAAICIATGRRCVSLSRWQLVRLATEA